MNEEYFGKFWGYKEKRTQIEKRRLENTMMKKCFLYSNGEIVSI